VRALLAASLVSHRSVWSRDELTAQLRLSLTWT